MISGITKPMIPHLINRTNSDTMPHALGNKSWDLARLKKQEYNLQRAEYVYFPLT